MLRYPIEKTDEYKATVTFKPMALNSSVDVVAGKVAQDFGEFLRGVITGKSSIKSAKTSSDGGSAQKISLYMPPSMQFSDGVQIENVDLSPAVVGAAMALSNLDADAGVINQATTAIGGMFEKYSITNMVDMLRQGGTQEMGAIAVRTASRAGLPDGLLRSSTRIANNPNTRALFKSVNIREFAFAFKMIPNSASEAAAIENIINSFRTELYPEVITVDGIPLSYKFPNLFQIDFLYDGRPMDNVPKILPCFLRGLSTNFNPSSMAFHKGGKFSEIDLSLQFIEARPLDKKDIKEGY